MIQLVQEGRRDVRSRRSAQWIASLVGMIILAATAFPQGASGARPPTAQEARAIWRVVLADCRSHDSHCRRAGIRVSTANLRFAYARTRAENFYNGALVRREASSGRWRILMIQGGGIQSCSEWRQNAPMSVLRDFGIEGFEQGHSTGTPCWETSCAGPNGPVPGAQGIYSLTGELVGCKAARKLVREYHSIRQQTGNDDFRVSSFDCTGDITENFEGLVVECRRGKDTSVNWIAQFIY